MIGKQNKNKEDEIEMERSKKFSSWINRKKEGEEEINMDDYF